MVAQDAAALESRLASLQGLRAARGAWFGMGALLREEEALRARLDELALVAERRHQAEEERLAERRLEADAWRELIGPMVARLTGDAPALVRARSAMAPARSATAPA